MLGRTGLFSYGSTLCLVQRNLTDVNASKACTAIGYLAEAELIDRHNSRAACKTVLDCMNRLGRSVVDVAIQVRFSFSSEWVSS